jgi:uncharacterized membrane protein YbhN (UPF0104 family)
VKRLDEHQLMATILAFGLAAGAVLGIAGAYGFGTFTRAWSQVHPAWIAVIAGAELLTVPAYVVAYRAVAAVNGGPRLRPVLALRVVTAGFGPFAVSGGFALDHRTLSALSKDSATTVRVLGLGVLEWAVLAPAACASAVVLLIAGPEHVLDSVLWSWVIAVPVGFAAGLYLAVPARRRRLESGGERWRRPLGTVLRGVGVLFSVTHRSPERWSAWLGTALYWAFDITAFYAAARFAGLRLDLGVTIIAYATGYALTRRSSPFGGAGLTEALMTFSLHWAGQPIASSLVAVAIYRIFNFALPTVPALVTHQHVKALLER